MNLERVKYRVQRGLRRVGVDVTRLTQGSQHTTAEQATIDAVAPFTMTSPERIVAVCDAVRHVVANSVPGAIVECGVWRGGSMMAAARTLSELGSTDRELYLYDTFAGMTAPSEHDRNGRGKNALHWMQRYGNDESGNSKWCNASIEDVEHNLTSTGYPRPKMTFVKGPVEDTLPGTMPEQIAVLRLDTDWYESTAHELEHLFPLVAPGGVLILDDYGHWQGARKAVDEYLADQGVPLFLQRIDYTGRMAVVPGPVHRGAA